MLCYRWNLLPPIPDIVCQCCPPPLTHISLEGTSLIYDDFMEWWGKEILFSKVPALPSASAIFNLCLWGDHTFSRMSWVLAFPLSVKTSVSPGLHCPSKELPWDSYSACRKADHLFSTQLMLFHLAALVQNLASLLSFGSPNVDIQWATFVTASM